MEQRILFESALFSLENGFKGKNNITKNGKIYKLNDSNNSIYIGSTTEDLNLRLERHKMCISDTSQYAEQSKFHRYMRSNKTDLSISLLLEKEFNSTIEMELYEDYYIFLFDAINKGLNSKYNTTIASIINKNNKIFQKKYEMINDYISKHCDSIIRYRTFINDNEEYINKISNLNEPIIIDNGWIKINNITQFNPFLMKNWKIEIKSDAISYSMPNEKLNEKITGVYLFYWNNGKYIKTYCCGGLRELFCNNRISFRESKVIKYIMMYGFNFNIYPLMYVTYDINDMTTVGQFLKKTEKMINLNNINDIIKNVHLLHYNTYTILELNIFFDKLPTDVKRNYSLELYEFQINMFVNKNKKEMIEYSNLIDINNKTELHKEKGDTDELHGNYESTNIKKSNEKVNVEKSNGKVNIEINDGGIKIEIQNKTIDLSINNIDVECNSNNKIPTAPSPSVFHDKPGRPIHYKSDEERRNAKLDAKRKWREKNKNHISEYNKKYRDEN